MFRILTAGFDKAFTIVKSRISIAEVQYLFSRTSAALSDIFYIFGISSKNFNFKQFQLSSLIKYFQTFKFRILTTVYNQTFSIFLFRTISKAESDKTSSITILNYFGSRVW